MTQECSLNHIRISRTAKSHSDIRIARHSFLASRSQSTSTIRCLSRYILTACDKGSTWGPNAESVTYLLLTRVVIPKEIARAPKITTPHNNHHMMTSKSERTTPSGTNLIQTNFL